MQNIKLVIAYDGTDFHGFARQRNLRTVQGTLEDTLQRLLGCPVEVFGSGRTDAGVHARGQVVNWVQPFGPPPDRYVTLLQKMLPPDIIPVSAEAVSEDFHARFSAVGKTYRYTVQRAKIEDIYTKRYTWHVQRELNVTWMEEAANQLVGEHDFTSFCAASTPVSDKRRTIHDLRVETRDTYLDITCSGSGFLQYMVRIISGTLVDVGLGRIPKDSIAAILEAQDRRLAGRTAPPNGLTLWQVFYNGS